MEIGEISCKWLVQAVGFCSWLLVIALPIIKFVDYLVDLLPNFHARSHLHCNEYS